MKIMDKYIDLEFPTHIESNGEAFIDIIEDLDSEQSGEALRIAFDSLYNQGKKRIILDMSKVKIINSYGIGKILICDKKLKDDNGELVIKDANGFVDEILKLLMLDKVLTIR